MFAVFICGVRSAGGFEVCSSSATSDILGELPDIPMGQGAHSMWGVRHPSCPPTRPLSPRAAGTLHSLQRYLKFPVQSPKVKIPIYSPFPLRSLQIIVKVSLRECFRGTSRLCTYLTFIALLPGRNAWPRRSARSLGGGVLFQAQASAQLLGPRSSHHGSRESRE